MYFAVFLLFYFSSAGYKGVCIIQLEILDNWTTLDFTDKIKRNRVHSLFLGSFLLDSRLDNVHS
jgi:hypothetical protein